MSARYFEAAKHAVLYAKYRPSPPPSIILRIVDYLNIEVPSNGTLMSQALDVGCGSGQSTALLAPHFVAVTGFDVSKAQVDEANKSNTLANVSYRVSGAEKLPFPPHSLQLVTSSQACHWFNMPAFFAEVDRILVPGGVVALYGYLFPRVMMHPKAAQLTAVIDNVYEDKLSGCWGKDRKYVDNAYTDDCFKIPYADCVRDYSHSCHRRVSVTVLQGYISSWSGYQQYCLRHGAEAGTALLENFKDRLMAETEASTAPEDTFLDIRYPYFLLMGRKPGTADCS